MPPDHKTLVCIGGPTASGKTSLAIELALHFKTEIISADSRQVYKYFNIGTAKPSQTELKLVRHHFVDEIHPEVPFNAGEFERAALERLQHIFEKNDWAIAAGGTGLFFKALLEGLDDFPEVPHECREAIQEQFEKEGLAAIREQLRRLDPVYYDQADIDNPNRIIRALSVCAASGRPYSSFLNSPSKARPFRSVRIALHPDRSILYGRIERRVDGMIEQGLEEEARDLLKYAGTEAFNTVGYKEWLACFKGEESPENTISLIKRNSRRYAKRQFTWFNNQGTWHKLLHPDLKSALDIIQSASQ